MRILLITSEWPTPEHPEWAPVIVQQVKFLKQKGAQVEVFPFRGGKSPWNYWKAWRRLRQQYDLEVFDVLHAHFGQSGLLALPKRKPLVVTFHGSDLQGYFTSGGRFSLRGRLLRQVSRFVARRATEVIVVSESLARQLPKGVEFHVVPGGIDLDLFRPIPWFQARRRLGLPEDRSLVMFTGNPADANKRYSLAAAAVDLLSQSVKCELCLVQNVPHDEMPYYLSAGDVLLLTSLQEGSPTVVKEALACNLPVVSLNVGDVSERLHAVAGSFVCADEHPETIAQDLRKALLFPRIQFAGRNAVADLSEDRVAGRVMSVYQRVVRRWK